MVNRAYIKSLAKNRMSGRIGKAILVCFLVSILGGDSFVRINIVSNQFNENGDNYNFFQTIGSSILLPAFLAFGAFVIVYYLLVGNVISIGARGWVLRYWRGEEPPVSDIFAGFRSYTAFVSMGLLRNIYVFLWSLLFIIPGIIMSYAYSMADYILCEYPNLSASQALDLSKRITNGFKGELFLFDLSFFGWQILSLFTCGVLGIVYVNPYIFTSHAGVYEALKINALQQGVVHLEDFGIATAYPPYNNPYNY